MALMSVHSWRFFALSATLSSWIPIIISQNMIPPPNLPTMFRPAIGGGTVPTGTQIALPPIPAAQIPAPNLPVVGGLPVGGFPGGLPVGGLPAGGVPVQSPNFLGLFGNPGAPGVLTGLCTFGCGPIGFINVTPPTSTTTTTTTTTPPPPVPIPIPVPPPAIIPYPIGCPILACLCQLCACPVCTTCGIGGIGVGGIGGIGGIGGFGGIGGVGGIGFG